MNFLRRLYIKTTNITHGYQDEQPSKLISFYHLWSRFYDVSIKLDPAYCKNLRKMIDAVVAHDDITLDCGCGTGLGTIYASTIAQKVVGIDPSKDMLIKLRNKIEKQHISNIDIREGFFPQAIEHKETFKSIISSFMFAHLGKKERIQTIKAMFEILEPGGRIGLFSAQGEIASTFQTKEEIVTNLSSSGFSNILIEDVDDIYRIAKAEKRKI